MIEYPKIKLDLLLAAVSGRIKSIGAEKCTKF